MSSPVLPAYKVPPHLQKYFRVKLDSCYVCHLVEIFREVRRVLRKDGTVWLNFGDSYVNHSQPGGGDPTIKKRNIGNSKYTPTKANGLKPKDLCMIPARVAIALQADGWWLRQDIIEEVEVYCPHCGWQLEERIWRHGQDREIIWKKPNPMPESVTDRCTKSHEYIFLLTKSAKYFYDADAVREEPATNGLKQGSVGQSWHDHKNDLVQGDRREKEFNGKFCGVGGRNKRSVWNIATHPFPDAHFATFPPKLIEPCILAGTSEKGCCAECGSPWARVVEKGLIGNRERDGIDRGIDKRGERIRAGDPESKTIGWEPGCECKVEEFNIDSVEVQSADLWDYFEEVVPEPVPCTVLDIFAGSMTTAIVAYKHGRKFIMVELSETYIKDIGIPRIEKETRQLKLFN